MFTADAEESSGTRPALPTPPLESMLETGCCIGCTTDLMHYASSGPQRRARKFNFSFAFKDTGSTSAGKYRSQRDCDQATGNTRNCLKRLRG